MFKNKKGQISITILLFGMILIALVLISLSLAANQSIRSVNYVNNKQLDKLVEGGVYSSIALLKSEIDYEGFYGFPGSIYPVNNFGINDNKASINVDIKRATASDFSFQNGVVEEDLEYISNHSIYKIGEEAMEVEFYINHANDTCFQIMWDNDAEMRFTIYRDTVDVANVIGKTPEEFVHYESNTGLIGSDSGECTTANPVRLTAKDIYDESNSPYRVRGGYGRYVAVLEHIGGPTPENLRTEVLYNRLNYRTFVINMNDIVYGTNIKGNTKVYIQAEYNGEDHSDFKPRFKYIRWREGDE